MDYLEFEWPAVDELLLFGRVWLPDTDIEAMVCLVHGLGEHSGRYAHLAIALAEAGFALAAFDLRGHGKSQGKRGHTPTYETSLDDITSFLDEVEKQFPQRRHFLYGHSLGGNLVLNYALRCRRQLDGVVVTSPWLGLAFKPSPWKMTLAQILNRLWPGLSLDNGLDIRMLSRDHEVVKNVENDPMYHHRITPRMAISTDQAARWALRRAAQFRLPLLLMHGSADGVTSAEASRQFASRVPGDCTFKLWPDFYHEIHNEPQQQEVFAYTVDWLRHHC